MARMSEEMEYSKRLMLAEDNDDDFLIFSVAIKESKLAVALSRAVNGEIFMDMLRMELPDVLFLDLYLPYKSGKQCIREIRADRRYDNLPIIVYTGIKDVNDVEFCYREGANLYIHKPSSLKDLVEIIKRILSINWQKTLYYPERSKFVLGVE